MLAAVLSFLTSAPYAFGTHSIAIARPETKKLTINGTLKRTIEKGGWLIVSDKKKFLILNAGEFADNSWFIVGAKVRANGSLRNHPTFFMEGRPFKLDKLTPRRTQNNSVITATVSTDN